MRYFDPILLEGWERPPVEFQVTPELVKEVPYRIADLYGQMPNSVEDERHLTDICRRIDKLYKSYKNRNVHTEDPFAGTFPPLLLAYFAQLNAWPDFMGLVLLSGFCPCALSGLSPSELLDLTGYPTAKRLLEQVARDKSPRLLRLDSLTISKAMLMKDYDLIHRSLPIKPYDFDIGGHLLMPSWLRLHAQRLKLLEQKDTIERILIEYFDSDIYGQLLRQFRQRIDILLIKWIEYRAAIEGNTLRLPPSEFVRFAEKIKFDIPWLGFAKAHFPHLLPEESTGRPISSTEDQTLESQGDLSPAPVPKSEKKRKQPTAGVEGLELGSPEWRSQNARNAANARHDQPGGSRDKQQKICDLWATGKYSSRDRCAEEECEALNMSFSTARKALQNTPDSTPST